jgi:DNA-directed RNA polymerase specialized sigma24 family protein
MPGDGSNVTSASWKRFPPTLWTEVMVAAGGDNTVAVQALGKVLERYDPLVRAYIGLRFHVSPEKARDLWQEFVYRKVLEDCLLKAANRARGRFRDFLLTSINHFVISEFRKESAQSRSPEKPLVPLDELVPQELPAQRHPQLNRLDLDWVRAIIHEALESMESYCRATDQTGLWEVFEGRFLRPILDGASLLDYETLVRRHGFKSPAQASNALITAKRMFRRYLSATVVSYSEDAESAERELGELAQIGD